MKKKILTGIILSSALMSALSFSAFSGWKESNGNYYYEENGQVITSNWLRMNNNGSYVYYYMGNDGYMQRGWTKINNVWYYFGTDGIMKTGWISVSNEWYYLDPSSGQLQTGWLKLTNNGTTVYYYLKANGSMATGWRQINNSWYFFLDVGSDKKLDIKFFLQLLYGNRYSGLR